MVVLFVSIVLLFFQALPANAALAPAACHDQFALLLKSSPGEVVNDKAVLQVPVRGRSHLPDQETHDLEVVSLDPATGERQSIRYSRTNRGLVNDSLGQTVNDYYPPEMLTDDFFREKKILDAGTGGGAFVTELKGRGHDIRGVDLYLSDEQLKQAELFQKADLKATPYADEEFDLIYSTWSVFSYETMKDVGYHKEFNREIFPYVREMSRILKKGGKLLISPLSLTDDKIAELEKASGGHLEFKRFTAKDKKGRPQYGFEAIKIR